jgi:DNA-directed RNA polymerase subunit RPC12/RpoP
LIRSAGERLVVATQCPSCGAALDFSEGNNSVACGYCRASSLVTGRGRTLAYTVPARVTARDAFGTARFAEPSDAGPFRVMEPRLFFLPYYRFRALELLWRRPDPAPRPFLPPSPDPSSDYRPAISIERALADLQPGPDDVELDERHIEKNFLALEAPGIELYSLGLRASALKLSLFGRHELDSQGTVVAPEIPADLAVERGARSANPGNVAGRQVLAPRLSLVYFPFWFVPVHRIGKKTVTVIDGVSQSVVLRGEDEQRFAHLRVATGSEETVGFRPLVCPNCGWALPVRADDFVFFCSTCERAWKILGQELLELPHRIVGVAPAGSRTARYLPIWQISGSLDDEAPRRFLAPAFRYRRMRALAELATKLSRRPPELASTTLAAHEVHGVYFDESDAAALISFAEMGNESDRFEEIEARRERRLAVDGADLLWAPFTMDGYAYVDPFLGTSLPKNLLI